VSYSLPRRIFFFLMDGKVLSSGHVLELQTILLQFDPQVFHRKIHTLASEVSRNGRDLMAAAIL
jgi:hypothetical protein